jgi:predicted GIY-YIG superfamily endonuclease
MVGQRPLKPLIEVRILVPQPHSDLKKRIQNHISGNGGQTTSKKNDWKLIYYEAYFNKHDAIGREKFLK